MNWSTDIAAAPRGRKVRVSKVVKGKTHTTVSMEREPVWLATKCGKVIRSEWLWPRKVGQYGTRMTKARWSMIGANEQPLAWRPFIKGEFPVMVDPKTKERSYPNGTGPEYPAMILGVAA